MFTGKCSKLLTYVLLCSIHRINFQTDYSYFQNYLQNWYSFVNYYYQCIGNACCIYNVLRCE